MKIISFFFYSDSGYTRTTFQKTPLISPSLIAVIVSDLQMKSNSNNGTSLPYRIFAQPMQIENTVFALAKGEQLMNVFTEYLNVPYTLPKMDLAAVPFLPFVGGTNNSQNN